MPEYRGPLANDQMSGPPIRVNFATGSPDRRVPRVPVLHLGLFTFRPFPCPTPTYFPVPIQIDTLLSPQHPNHLQVIIDIRYQYAIMVSLGWHDSSVPCEPCAPATRSFYPFRSLTATLRGHT